MHAPNIHVGGGAVLLRALLSSSNLSALWANLDERVSGSLDLPAGAQCYFVKPTLRDRLLASLRLSRSAKADDVVLCFHGMPPVFPVKGRVMVFKQNRIHLGMDPLSVNWRTRLRQSIEKLICRVFRFRVDEYIVQTPSMKLAVQAWHGGAPTIRVMPFLNDLSVSDGEPGPAQKDFVYVADGETHKNHRTLIAAWILLAQEGIFPTLTLTLPSRFTDLLREIQTAVREHGLHIENVGSISHESILKLYGSAKALIFPSTTESFGLPLIEASAARLPIIASELDYVRDVCVPSETFNPHSAHSIAAAVKRFMNIAVPPLRIRSAEEFLAELHVVSGDRT